MSTRRVAMCAGHIIDELAAALLTCISIAAVFKDGLAFLLANARRANPARDRRTGRLQASLIAVGAASQVITYEPRLTLMGAAAHLSGTDDRS